MTPRKRTSRNASVPSPAKPGGWLAALGWESAAGLLLAAELTRIHVLVHTHPGYHASCDLGGHLNCGAVALSPYSVFLGAPVSAWGVMAYLLILVLSLWGRSSRKPHDAWPSGFLLALSGAACLASLGMAILSFTKIDAICLYCNGLHLVNAALLFSSAAHLERQDLSAAGALLRDAGAWRRPSAGTLVLTVLALVSTFGLARGWPKYWESPVLGSLNGLATGRTAQGEPWIGATFPKIVIVEFTDYECAFCRMSHRNVRQFLSRHADQVRLVHRHFPLDEQCNESVKRPYHKYACRFAAFAACAGREGRFWEANDALLAALDWVKPKDVGLEAIASRIGLTEDRWRTCLDEGSVTEEIRTDIEDGLRLGVTGTPAYFINGKRHKGFLTPEALEGILQGRMPDP